MSPPLYFPTLYIPLLYDIMTHVLLPVFLFDEYIRFTKIRDIFVILCITDIIRSWVWVDRAS